MFNLIQIIILFYHDLKI